MKRNLQSGEYQPTKLRNYFQPIIASIASEIKPPTHFKHGLKTKVAGLDIDIILTKYLRESDKLYEIVFKENWIVTSPIFHERRLKDKDIDASLLAAIGSVINQMNKEAVEISKSKKSHHLSSWQLITRGKRPL